MSAYLNRYKRRMEAARRAAARLKNDGHHVDSNAVLEVVRSLRSSATVSSGLYEDARELQKEVHRARARPMGLMMVIAKLDTGNFEFIGAGRTEQHARGALLRAILEHCRQTGADEALLRRYAEDADVMTLQSGSGYRDSQRIVE